MTASLPDRRSFAIESPNGIKVSKYYHISNLLYCTSGWSANDSNVPKALVPGSKMNVG
jgi:hypothetical protein